jgi:hypothetical protein
MRKQYTFLNIIWKVDRYSSCIRPTSMASVDFTDLSADEIIELRQHMAEYREVIFSNKKEEELNETQNFIQMNLRWGRPPWMGEQEWKRVVEKNKKDGIPKEEVHDELQLFLDSCGKQEKKNFLVVTEK